MGLQCSFLTGGCGHGALSLGACASQSHCLLQASCFFDPEGVWVIGACRVHCLGRVAAERALVLQGMSSPRFLHVVVIHGTGKRREPNTPAACRAVRRWAPRSRAGWFVDENSVKGSSARACDGEYVMRGREKGGEIGRCRARENATATWWNGTRGAGASRKGSQRERVA